MVVARQPMTTNPSLLAPLTQIQYPTWSKVLSGQIDLFKQYSNSTLYMIILS